MALIELRNVVGGYGGAPILNGVNIAIEQSDIGVIVGPNGAGKSTTLKAIFGLLKITGGKVLFDGQEITNSLPDKLVPKGLSFVPQEKNVFTSMTVQENLEMGGFIRRDDLTGTLNEIFDMFPVLAEKRKQPAGELSGGNQQKVVLAKWLCMEPSLVILDEPTRGIDVGAKAEVYRLMRDLAGQGVAVLMISSDMEEVIGVSTRVAVMRRGRIVGILQRDDLCEEAILQLAVE